MIMKKKPDFLHFYHEYFDKIYRYIYYRVGGDRERAEDLTSEIFIKAMEHYESYDPAKSVSSWIYTIARNHLLNAFRDAKPAVSLEAAAELGDDIGVIPHDAMHAVLERAGLGDLERTLATVDEATRKLLMMKFVEGWSYRELARKYGRSSASLRVAVYRAMKDLRARFSIQ